ncbi:hypothetical protein EYF80_034217 [Liparis tanakae]|uniref:Uncharacterized protein n=1 Tax=Liparis tanakae TaxID=230148 RepID=A0A4Z2GQB0_9TELE|nr:hypothetical protein EYF80_034217 [Liparis tanakae]
MGQQRRSSSKLIITARRKATEGERVEERREGAGPSARPPARQFEGPPEDPDIGSLGPSRSLLDHTLYKYWDCSTSAGKRGRREEEGRGEKRREEEGRGEKRRDEERRGGMRREEERVTKKK